MSTNDRDGARIFTLFCSLALFGALIYLRFADLDMSNARFLVTYWWLYLPLLLTIGVYSWLKGRC
jgi:hypothetical protein